MSDALDDFRLGSGVTASARIGQGSRFKRGPGLLGDILVYLALTILFSGVFCALALTAALASVGDKGSVSLYVTGLMWSPGTAALITTWLRRGDFRAFGWAWGGTRWALLAYLLPLGYAAVAYGILWMAGWGSFADTATVAKLAAGLGWTQIDHWAVVLGYVLLTGTIGMVASVSTALGEEIGWRGFFAPRMIEQAGFTGGVLIVGAIWALWHVPLIVFGDYNQGAPIWITIPCFTVLILSASVIITWVRLRSRSVWPSAILHASHNLFIQAVFTPLTGSKGVVTAYTMGEFGLCVPVVLAAVALYFWTRRGEAMAAWYADR